MSVTISSIKSFNLKLGLDKKPADKIKKQAIAAIGQAELIKIYDIKSKNKE